MLLHEYFYSEIKERVDMKGTEHYVGGVKQIWLCALQGLFFDWETFLKKGQNQSLAVKTFS